MSVEFKKDDVLRVANELLLNSITFDCSDYNSQDFYTCTYCHAEDANDENIKHDINCVTLVAQDLLTRSIVTT